MEISDKRTLLIMAAGLGSRFGGLKQMTLLGPHKKTLLHYSIYDAVYAGFNKIVFIIRRSFEEEFKNSVGKYAESLVETHYSFQEMDRLPGNMPPIKREKPWGTAHAIWSAKDIINEPFIAINADDFYGRDAFVKLHDFLLTNHDSHHYSLAGYRLDQTLSENGTVARGICEVDDKNNLTTINEATKIIKESGIIKDLESGLVFPPDNPVSMNFWGFTPTLFEEIENQFIEFYNKNRNNLKSEIYIPSVVDRLLKDKKIKVKVLNTNAKWFGITYKEDTEIVDHTLKQFDKEGMYMDM